MGAAWVAAIAAAVVAVPVTVRMVQQILAASSPWKRQKRRELAWTRMAEYIASVSSQGYPDHYARYLEHYLGGRAWTEGWDTEGWEQPRMPDTFG